MERLRKRCWRGLMATLTLVGSLQAQTLKQIATIDLPGPKGERFDYLTMDDEDHYLLSAHLGPSILYVIDVRTNTLVKAIPGVPGITGLEYVQILRKVEAYGFFRQCLQNSASGETLKNTFFRTTFCRHRLQNCSRRQVTAQQKVCGRRGLLLPGRCGIGGGSGVAAA